MELFGTNPDRRSHRFDRCVFCQRNTEDILITGTVNTTLDPLLDPDDQSQATSSGRETLLYHKKCYALRWKQRKQQKHMLAVDSEPSSSASPKKLRSIVDLTFDNMLCVFCQSKKKVSKKGPLIEFSTSQAQSKVESSLLKCNNKILTERLRGVDLVANEVKYHRSCYSSFLMGVDYNYVPKQSNLEKGTLLQATYSHFKHTLQQGKAISVKTVVEYYNSLSEEVTREERSILRSFMAQYQDSVQIVQNELKEQLLISKSFTLQDLINNVQARSETPQSMVGNADIRAVAAQVAADIKSKWKPIDGFNISEETIEEIIPQSLSELISEICRGTTGSSQSKRTSIAMDVIALSLNRIPPTHLTLAVSVKHLTGCREIIDQLNRMGHCCSYTELLRFETAAAVNEIRYAEEHGVIIPPITQNSDRGLLQAAADNDDFLEETIDGKNTTHGTTMVLIQHTGTFPLSFNRPMAKTRRRSLNPDELKNLLSIKPIEHPKKTSFPGIKYTEAIRSLKDTDFLTSPEMSCARNLDMQWIICRLAPSKLYELNIQPSSQECPSWSSWNARRTVPSPQLKAVVGYCPMINAKSDDPSTVYTVLLQLKNMMRVLGQKHSVITFDLAIYKVAKEVVWSRPTEFEDTIVRLGGFHIITNFLGALGSMLQTSGALGLLTETGLYSEVTAKHILSGSQYNRGIRAHKVLLEALMRMKLNALKDWVADAEDPLSDYDMSGNISDDELQTVATILSEKLGELDNVVSEHAYMYKFWSAYIAAVQTLLGLIRSERSANWRLYLDSLIAMLPTFYAYDRVNYSRWLPIYISDMLNLETDAPQVHQAFMLGQLSINRTGKSFAAIPTDQVLEQTLNKDSKVSGGIRGISTDEEARTKWFLTSHVRAHMYSIQKQIFSGLHTEDTRHREDVGSRTMKDEADVQTLLDYIERSGVDIFSLESSALVDISTGTSPPEASVKAILGAFETGAARAKKFIVSRLCEKTVSFDATLSKQKVPPFNMIHQSDHPCKAAYRRKKVEFAKLLIIGQSRRIDVKQLLHHETGGIPLSLFDEKGKLRKTTKSQLAQTLEEHYLTGEKRIDHSAGSKRALIIDGMVMIQMHKGQGTFKEYSETIFSEVLAQGNGYDRIDVVFDVYDRDSIKAMERERRGTQKMFSVKILNGSTKIPKKWHDFLSNINNKNELVEYLQRSWKSEMTEKIPDGKKVIVSSHDVISLAEDPCSYKHLVSNHDEADTRLIMHCADTLRNHDTAVIRTVDTDILVLAIHHYKMIIPGDQPHKDIVLWLGTGKNNRHVSVGELVMAMPDNVTKNLLSAYALTGCDATSALYRVSKRKSISVLQQGNFDLTMLGEKEEPLNNECHVECERYLAALYGDYMNLTDARYDMLATKSITNESLLPPSTNAAKYHIRRSAFQVLLWKQSLSPVIQRPSASDYGWDLEMKPIHCDSSPIQNELAVTCRCKKNKCNSQSCRCLKQKFKCTDSCMCQGCENSTTNLEDSADEEEDADDDAEVV